MYKTRDVTSARAKEVIATIRALIISKKGDICEKEVQEDYRELMGENIPYRDLGFNDLGKFLLATGEFVYVSHYKGYASIRAKSSVQSAHIAALVSKQKPGKDDKKIKIDYKMYEELWPVISFEKSTHVPSYEEFFKQLDDNIAKDKFNRELIEEKTQPSEEKPHREEQFSMCEIDKFQVILTPGMHCQDVRTKGREHRVKNVKILVNRGRVSTIYFGNLKFEAESKN